MIKILIIGGTRFVGRNLIEHLIKFSHYDLTLFNRGITNADLFPTIKKIKGDRKVYEDIQKFSNEDWDCIIDISGYWPMALEQQFALQKGKVGKYIYISTSSHYQFDIEKSDLISEDRDLVHCSFEEKNSEDLKYYNQHKAECERILESQKDLDYIILRPGLIIGKYDYTDRMYYWFHKVFHQKEILVGEKAVNEISYTHVNDLAKMITQSIEIKNCFKIYNASSFAASLSDFIRLAEGKLKKEVELISASGEFLKEHQVSQWTGLPLWINGDFFRIDNSRLKKDYDFNFKTIDETVNNLLDYYSNFKNWEQPKLESAPLSNQKELELINLIK